jgi:hypothetical protein
MRTATERQVRELLRSSQDGLTLREIHAAVPRDPNNLRRVLQSMPDTYIDRWLERDSKPAAVWSIVVPPEDCPKPTKRKKKS